MKTVIHVRRPLRHLVPMTALACALLAPLDAAAADGRPDLAVRALTAPSAPLAAGAAFEVRDAVQNAGGTKAKRSLVRYYLSPDGVRGAGDLTLGGRAVGALRGRALSRARTVLTLPSGTAAGSYLLLACADALGVVRERNETNNCRAASVSVEPAARPEANDGEHDHEHEHDDGHEGHGDDHEHDHGHGAAPDLG